jgi:hypothetical protein
MSLSGNGPPCPISELGAVLETCFAGSQELNPVVLFQQQILYITTETY